MIHLHPSTDQIAELIALDVDGPINMLNMLRFNDVAQYADESGEGPCSGPDAYARYSKAVGPLLENAGGDVVASWRPQLIIIGPRELDWDESFVVRYPSKQAFLEMINADAYKAIVHHRTAALADSRLILMLDGS